MPKSPPARGSRRRPPQILVLFEGQWHYQRAMLRGILRYASEHTNWGLRHAAPDSFLQRTLLDWPWDGMLVQADRPLRRLLRKLRGDGRPVVSLADTRGMAPWPCVTVDDQLVGQMAAEFLLSRQARRYAYIGGEFAFSRARQAAFIAALARRGVRGEILLFSSGDRGQRSDDARLVRLLRSWPKPVAVFAGNDHWAFWLASLCAVYHLSVPDDVAILGVDDEQLLCEFSHPTLSSIAVPAEETGYRGAAMLAQLLDRRTRSLPSQLLPPRCVVPRRSTELYATADPLVRQAQGFMSDHLAERINVKQVAEELQLSRRLLERRFGEALGHTPHAELMRLRIARAQSLLQATQRPLAEIAQQCGFRDASHFSLAFHRQTGKVPSACRQTPPG